MHAPLDAIQRDAQGGQHEINLGTDELINLRELVLAFGVRAQGLNPLSQLVQ